MSNKLLSNTTKIITDVPEPLDEFEDESEVNYNKDQEVKKQKLELGKRNLVIEKNL